MTEGKIEQIIAVIEGHIESGKVKELKALLSSENASDVAEAVRELDEEIQDFLFTILEDEVASDVLEEAHTPTRLDIIEELDSTRLSNIIQTMPPDEAIDLLDDLSDEVAQEVLDQVPKKDSEQLRELLQYEPDTAGGIMTPVVVKVSESDTVDQAIEYVRKTVVTDVVFYIYVVSSSDKLVGIARSRRLLISKPERRMGDIMETELVSVPADMDQEEVARIVTKYNLLAIPVVDSDGALLGQITADDIMEVMEEEATEDAFKLAGTDDAELRSESA